MPLYEFECTDCSAADQANAAKEILVRSPAETPVCPDCGGEKLVRLMSATAAPAMASSAAGARSLPMSSGASSGEACGAPRCCGGGCQI